MIATVDQRPLVNLDLIRWHLVASATFFAVSLLGGLSYAMQFNNLYPFPGIEWLSPGRVRMVHTNMAAYGFIANAFIGGMLFAIPRLTSQPMLAAYADIVSRRSSNDPNASHMFGNAPFT